MADRANADDPLRLVSTHVALGHGYTQRKQLPDADRHFRAAWTVCETFPPPLDDRRRTLVGSVAFMLGLVRAEERPADAAPWFGRAINAFAQLHTRGNTTAGVHLRSAHESRATVSDHLENFADAVTDWDATLALSDPGNRPALRASRA